MDFLKDSQRDVEVARTMVQNRLATDLNDAMMQIQKKKEAGAELAKNKAVEKPVEIKEVTATGTTPSISATNDSERLKEIEKFLKRFDQFFSKFHNDTQSRLTELSKEVTTMKDQILNLRLYARSTKSEQQANLEIKEETRKEQGSFVSQKPGVSVKTEKKEEKKQEKNPRSGNFKPGDIDIRDIFNNAHGKMLKKK